MSNKNLTALADKVILCLVSVLATSLGLTSHSFASSVTEDVSESRNSLSQFINVGNRGSSPFDRGSPERPGRRRGGGSR